MTNDERVGDGARPAPAGDGADDGASRESRRRLLKGAAAAVPLIVSLRARPLHAQVTGGSLGAYAYGDQDEDPGDQGGGGGQGGGRRPGGGTTGGGGRRGG